MQSLQFCWFQTFLLYKINIICFFYTIIGRVKSFEDYWINLKSYYWSINWKLLLGLWIKTKRAGFWASFSFNFVIQYCHLVIISHGHIQWHTLTFTVIHGHLFIRSLTSRSTTQLLNMKILICCIGV